MDMELLRPGPDSRDVPPVPPAESKINRTLNTGGEIKPANELKERVDPERLQYKNAYSKRPEPLPVVQKSEAGSLPEVFKRNFFRFRKKWFKIFGGSFDVFDWNDNKILYSHQKEFRLREDFRVYDDNTRKNELLRIRSPDIFDFHATYHVDDSKTDKRIGSIKRSWFRSLFRDKWVFYSPEGKEIGILEESSWKGALASRLFGVIFPQKYTITDLNKNKLAVIEQQFNPFVLKYDLRIMTDRPSIDRRLLVASGLLLAGIEGRQGSSSAGSGMNMDSTG